MTNWRKAILLEQKVQEIITQQELNGVKFDTQKARFYVHELEELCTNIENKDLSGLLKYKVNNSFPTVKKPFNKTGELSKRTINYLGEQSKCVAGPFTPVRFELIKISQRKEIAKELLSMGWKPIDFTEKGQPQLCIKGEPVKSLEKVTGVGPALAMWYKYKHRQSQIVGLLSKVRGDGRLSAGANTIGTNTGRFRHRTVVNIPKADPKVVFGKQIRSLFTCDWKKGWRLLGGDAKGLEARMEAHNCFDIDGGQYAKELLEGDIHSKNASIFGCDRQTAKSGKYAITYGARVPKFSETIGVSREEGERLFEAFWEGNDTLRRFTEDCQRSSLRGFVDGLDGRRVYMRRFTSTVSRVTIGGVSYPNPLNVAISKAVNTKFQSDGAIVMKYSICLMDKWIKERGLQRYVKKVIDQHDESQYEFLYSEELFLTLKELYIESIVKAGQLLKLNVPLDGDVKLGINWSQTH